MDKLIRVETSGIENKGVFAAGFIEKGTRIIEYTGKIISGEELEKCLLRDSKHNRFYLFELDDDRCKDGLNCGNNSIYINHSCEPNCYVDINGDRIWIVAARGIEKNEELTYDYKCDFDPSALLVCKCGSKKCRGYILSEEALIMMSRKVSMESPLMEAPLLVNTAKTI